MPHRGGNDAHNECADKIPNNSFPGRDVLVNGKNFDALQLATRTLWEVKTDNFDKYNRLVSEVLCQSEAAGNTARERGSQRHVDMTSSSACSSEAHKDALESAGSHPQSRRHGLVLT